ncbi:MAG TPA: Gfo/Idh/MocA family oxidoreductase [Puia sp.]|nr:Gfo/Idh/MocA family oxidoreductase [Puia sp.]
MSGRIFHAPFLNTHPGFNFTAVTERSQKKAKAFYPGVKSYPTTEELIQDEELELIIVNTPNDTHYKYAEQALLAGKHVLIEKPFATSLPEAKELYVLAGKQQRHVMAFQNRRNDSDFESVKNVIESHRLGKLIEVHFRFDRYRPQIEAKAFKELPVPGSGLAYNLGPHLLDQVISLFGKPLQCHKSVGANRNGSQVDDYAFFHLIYGGNLNVFIHVSLLVARALPAFVIHGTNGSYIKDRTDTQEKQLDQGISPLDAEYGMELPGSEGELTLVEADGQRKMIKWPSIKGNYAQIFEAVYQQIRNNRTYPIRPEHILWQLEILEGPVNVIN